MSQSEIEDTIDRKLKKIENAYKLALDALEDKNLAERTKILQNFDQEKKILMAEQKTNEEMLLAEQYRNLQTAFAQEKHELVQKHETEKSCLRLQHQQEITVLQERLLEAQSQIQDSISLKYLVQHLETQIAKCQEDRQHLENQKTESDLRLQLQEVTLKREFEEERKKLEHNFQLQEINNETKLKSLFERGVEGLTGKLIDDFLNLVREHSEKEVRKSQAVLLNQLQKDRKDMASAIEEEKHQIYEKTDKERKALITKYEKQITALKTEMEEVHSQLEAEKQMVSQISLRVAEESIASDHALETLRKTMERELLHELARLTDSFESEKRDLEEEKTKLQNNLSELNKLLIKEKQKASDIGSLKETIRVLMTEKKELETANDKMREKFFHNYQKIKAEREDAEVRLETIRDEAESRGRMEGLAQGREDGVEQGRQQGYEEGYKKGIDEGHKDGYNQGKQDAETKLSKALEVMKKDYDQLLKEKSEFEEALNRLKSEIHDENLLKSETQDNSCANTGIILAQLKTLNEEKKKLQELLNQTSDQLVKASTFIALAQSKFVRELELMKQRAQHMVEVESYTKLQINLVEHQRLVITLQDALRERESAIDKLVNQTEAETRAVTELMDVKIKSIQSKLNFTQEELATYKEKYSHICAKLNRRNLILKDLYVENSGLLKKLANSENKRKWSERRRKISERLNTY